MPATPTPRWASCSGQERWRARLPPSRPPRSGREPMSVSAKPRAAKPSGALEDDPEPPLLKMSELAERSG